MTNRTRKLRGIEREDTAISIRSHTIMALSDAENLHRNSTKANANDEDLARLVELLEQADRLAVRVRGRNQVEASPSARFDARMRATLRGI